jgi:3-oxoacyl-[acyl-carrier protein] reductase
MDLGLAGKSALVVGAGADIGRETALALAAEGAKVVLAGRRREALEETAGRVRASGGWAEIAPGDLADPDAAERLATQALAAAGRIDLLVNTAGPFPVRGLDPKGPGPLYGDDASWAEAFDGVLMTAVRLTRAVLPQMKAQGAGAIVHLGANSARYYNPMTAQFAAMKAALVHAVKNWARDAAPHNVRVNAVLPGWIRGERALQRLDQAAKAAGASPAEAERDMVAGHDNLYWTPRMGRPEEYASAIVFLLSERASYINGALLPVDGGTPVW